MSFYRSVTSSCSGVLYHLHDIQAFLYLAKYGVLTVKVWSASYGGVYLLLFLSEPTACYLALSLFHQFLLQSLQSCFTFIAV